MKDLKMFTIPFVGLKLGEHTFTFDVDNSFFSHFEYDDFNSVDLKVTLNLFKKTTLLELHFNIAGSVNVNCDLTNEPYDHPIAAEYILVVKFGEEYNDEFEDILILPHGEYEVKVAQYVYETIVLAMPSKRIHPGVEDGSLKSDILDKLEELSIDGASEVQNDKDKKIDPRWDSLKKLLTDK
ncbi:MAG: DUF177 domain-containing protein [Leeuwenhoekiella sp.]